MSHMPVARSSQRLFTANCEYVGIDKIRLMYPLDTEYSDGSSDLFTKHGVRTTIKGGKLQYAKGSIPTENGGTIYIELKDNATKVVLEYNPSRRMDLLGDSLCHPDDLEATVIWAIRALSTALMPIWGIDRSTGEFIHEDYKRWPDEWRKMVTIMRMDFARDIHSAFPAFQVSNLLGIKKQRYSNDFVYRNKGVPQTIVWGKSIRHSFYNKSLVHKASADENWHRFEIQVRTQELKKRGMYTLDGVTVARVHEALWERWEVSNYGSEFTLQGDMSSFARELAKKTTGTKAQTLIGIAFTLANNLPLNMNPRTISYYRNLAKECGFNLGDSLEKMGTETVFIDFATGEVLHSNAKQEYSTFSETDTDMDETINHILTIGASSE